MKRITGIAAILLMVATAAFGQGGQDTAVLRPGDVLRIAVWPDAALTGDFPIESNGEIYLPLIGAVSVGGRRVDEVRADLRDRYRRVVANAVVTAVPIFRVSIIGGVQRPDLYQVNPTHTVFDLVSLAGGFSQRARLSDIRLIRGDSVIVLNAERALERGEAALSIGLLSGDRLIVPERADTAPRVQLIWNILQATALLTTLAIQIF